MMTNVEASAERLDGRRLNRYKITAQRLGIKLSEYLLQGGLGNRYCIKCLKWKLRRNFLEYSSTVSSFTGTCKPCRGFKRKPAKVAGKDWGPAVSAAKALGITPKEWLAKRASGLRWCTTHKDWFDATSILNSPKYQGGAIIRCRACQARLIKLSKGRIS